MFKKGQKVWSSVGGWGRVLETDLECLYPVEVQFDEHIHAFTSEGSFTYTGPRCLFFQEVIAPEIALVPPIEYMKFRQGDVVLTHNQNILYVTKDSDESNKNVNVLGRIPESLDDEYDIVSTPKINIKKIIGNVYDDDQIA